jgi:solute carrier family 35 protein E1
MAAGFLCDRGQTAALIVLWWAFRWVFNLVNARLAATLPLPYTLAAVHFAGGLLFYLPTSILGIKGGRHFTFQHLQRAAPIALLHMIAHFSSLIPAMSLEHPSGLHQLIKSAEPLFMLAVALFFCGRKESFSTMVAAGAIAAGVMLTSSHDRDFVLVPALTACAANAAGSLRACSSKKAMDDPAMPNGADLFTLISLLALIGTIPIAFFIEGSQMQGAWNDAVDQVGLYALLKEAAFCSLAYSLYSEVSFTVLSRVSPLSSSIINTLKRIILILATAGALGTPIDEVMTVGCTIAGVGSLLYIFAGRPPAAAAVVPVGKKVK